MDLIRAWVESTRALLAQVEGALPPSSEMSEPFGAWGSRWFARRRAAGIERERRAVTEIMERAGHAQLATTQLYLRRGRVLAVARGERPFPTLPACLLGKST